MVLLNVMVVLIMIKLTVKQFKEEYFYKTDLIKMCREFGLPTYGTKAELNSYIVSYLDGISPSQIKPIRKVNSQPTLKLDEINLKTKVIGSGFAFNNDARKFFANYFGVEKFSFKKEMAIIKRKAEIDNDTSMNIADLIQKYVELKNSTNEYKKINKEEQTYQWNQFVKDFCASDSSNDFNNKLKVASIIWKHVRASDKPKKYSDILLVEYDDEIKRFKTHSVKELMYQEEIEAWQADSTDDD